MSQILGTYLAQSSPRLPTECSNSGIKVLSELWRLHQKGKTSSFGNSRQLWETLGNSGQLWAILADLGRSWPFSRRLSLRLSPMQNSIRSLVQLRPSEDWTEALSQPTRLALARVAEMAPVLCLVPEGGLPLVVPFRVPQTRTAVNKRNMAEHPFYSLHISSHLFKVKEDGSIIPGDLMPSTFIPLHIFSQDSKELEPRPLEWQT